MQHPLLPLLLLASSPPVRPLRLARPPTASLSSGTVGTLVSLQCPAQVDAASFADALFEAGAWYVSVSDGDAGSDDERPLFVAHPRGSDAILTSDSVSRSADGGRALWSNSTLEVAFDPSADVEGTLLQAAALAGLDGLPRLRTEPLAPKDWVGDVQSRWPPICMRDALTIRFPWHSDEAVADATRRAAAAAAAAAAGDAPPVLTLEPGCAFGTGEHATTRLCVLRLRELLAAPSAASADLGGPSTCLSKAIDWWRTPTKSSSASATPPPTPLRGATLLDYGSGSGVLSFAALLFGAERAVGVEIDEVAISASISNAEINGLADRFVARLPADEEARGGTYPLVAANILAGTLIELRETLAARVQPGGTLLLSGVLGEAQAERVQAAFEPWFGPWTTVYEDGWALLEARRLPS